ncbi:hypothetical protein HAX54_044166 [Datura stramonium]|uniref:Uncharacterized protein n=1 Tax=Datura stramonium TaxID=4076 RepID=A0ABS8RP87_DATST|nr:hypothetical protein [Datura stramonium]
MEFITTSENSNTHAYTRLDFLARSCTPGLAINSIGIKVEGIEKQNESVLSKMAELEKDKEAAFSKVAALEKEKRAALSKIDELEKEKKCTANKVALLEREGEAAFSKIAVLEKEKQAASSKIEELEKEKEDAARKIAFLKKELSTKKEKFGKYKNGQLRKEGVLRTKFEDFKRHTAECKIEKEVAMSKIAMLEKELETKEVRTYKQAIRALKEIQVEDKEPRENMKELTITMQKLTKERNYWETLAKQLKGKESKTAELVEARKEYLRERKQCGSVGPNHCKIPVYWPVALPPFVCESKVLLFACLLDAFVYSVQNIEVLSDLCSGDMGIGIKNLVSLIVILFALHANRNSRVKLLRKKRQNGVLFGRQLWKTPNGIHSELSPYMGKFKQYVSESFLLSMLLGLFKNIAGCMLDPPKSMHFWRI